MKRAMKQKYMMLWKDLMGQENIPKEVIIDQDVKVEEELIVSWKKEVNCLLEDGIQ